MNKNSLFLGTAILAIAVTGILLFGNSGFGNSMPFLQLGSMSAEAIAKKSVNYLNNNILAQGQTATLVGYKSENGIIKMDIKIGDNTYDSYATKDGKLFFPEAFDLNTPPAQQNQPAGQSGTAAKADIKKVDKPMLDVYVVSKCPYGLQVQRAIADAVNNVPSLADYIKVRYIGSVSAGGDSITAMHGEPEAKENLRQICIREEQKIKYWGYVACHIKSGETSACEKSGGVDSTKLNACVADKNRGVAYAKEDFALNSQYNIQGSPTLVLNSQQVSEFDFGGRSSDSMKNIICESAVTKPEFCSTKLTEAQAAIAFSATYAGSGSTGNSGANGANCAPSQ